MRSGDGNDLMFSTSESLAPIIAYKSYHHRPQVKTINHSTQLIIQINRQGIICTSSKVTASASVQLDGTRGQVWTVNSLYFYLTLNFYLLLTQLLASIFHLRPIITQVSFHHFGLSPIQSQGAKVKRVHGMNYSNLAISGRVILGYKFSEGSLHWPDFQ